MEAVISRRSMGGVGPERMPLRQPSPHSLSSRDPNLACIFVDQVPRKGLTPGRVTTIYRKEGESIEVARKVQFLAPSEKDQPGTERVYTFNSSGEFSEEVIRVSEFAKERLKQRGGKRKEYEEGSFSYATSLWDGASNISAVARNLFWIENGVDPNPGITKGLGFTSAGGLITGPIHVMDGLSQLQKAKKIGDVAGERLAKMNVAKGGLEVVNGGVMAASRTISLATLHTSSKTMEAAGTVLGNSVTGLSIGIFTIYALRFLRTLVGAVKIFTQIRKKSDEDAFNELIAKLRLNESDYKKALETFSIKNTADCIKMETASFVFSKEELQIFEKDEVGAIYEKVQAEFAKIDRTNSEYEKVLDWNKVEENFAAQILKELARNKMAKEVEYERIIGSKSLELIRNEYASGVFSSKAKSKIVKASQKELARHIVMHSLLLFATLIGIVSFIITTVYTGGATLVVGYVMMLVMNIILTGADTQGLFKTMQSLKVASAKQKALMVLFATVIVGITLTGAFFTGGGSMLLTALVVGGLMTSVQAGGMYYAWTKHSKNKLTDKSKFHMLSVGSADETSRKVPQLPSRRRRAVRDNPRGVSH